VAGRLYTRFWKLNEAAHRSKGASYHVDEKYCEMWTTSRWLSDPHTAHYVVAHEQVGHGPFFHGFLPYMESEFTKANPHLKPAWKEHYATAAEYGLDSEYIKTHPDELGVTYEKVASFTKDQVPLSLEHLRDRWEIRIVRPLGAGEQATIYPLRGVVLKELYDKSLLEPDVLHDVSEYHLEFHYGPSGEPAGLSVYQQRLTGEAEVARERFMRFNRAIAEAGPLTWYTYGRLIAWGHITGNYSRLRYWTPSYFDGATSEYFAECTALFTAPDHSKVAWMLMKDPSSPKVRELEESWRDVAEFIGERAIRDEAVYAGYPYWENV
jgi:hypothetical protein